MHKSGDDSPLEYRTPVQVQGLSDVIAMSAGGLHALALRRDRSVWAWGDNRFGQLGDAQASGAAVVRVPGLDDVRTISAGGSHSLALKSDGSLWTWGANSYGEIGVSDATCPVSATHGCATPMRMRGLGVVSAIAAGGAYSLAVSGGSVCAWGWNDYFQLGDGTKLARAQPRMVAGLSSIASVAASDNFSLAVGTDGSLWSWGSGALGDRGSSPPTVPAQVQGLGGSVQSAAAGSYHSVVLVAG